jgi:thiamine biosynthesis protein ThiI
MKAIVLFSSGIDSPVAAHLASKKGLELIGLNFYNAVLTNDYKNKILALGKLVGISKIYFADHSISHKNYRENCNPRFQCIFCKRIMMRVASEICEKENANFIITGDNIGQVATQTIPNLEVISSVTDKKILRPILTFDKNDAVDIAKEIGTYNINLEFKGGCPFLPDKPATTSNKKKIEFEENKIDVNSLIKEIIEKIMK